MQIAVLVEPVVGKGFRATSQAFALSVEGTTEQDAIERLERAVEERLANGTRLVTVNVPMSAPIPARHFGALEKDDLYDEWIRAMEERRRLVDEDDNAL